MSTDADGARGAYPKVSCPGCATNWPACWGALFESDRTPDGCPKCSPAAWRAWSPLDGAAAR